VQALAGGLATRDHEVTVITTQPCGQESTAILNGVTVRYLPVRNIYRPFGAQQHTAALRAVWHAVDSANPWMASMVGGLLEKFRPDVVHTHTIAGFSASVWRAAAEHGMPVIHTLHDYYLLCPRSSAFHAGRNCPRICTNCRIYGIPRRRATRFVTASIGVSEFLLNAHVKEGLFTDTPIREVIYNACGEAILSAPRVASVPVRIGYLGRLTPAKGLESLIDAYRSLPIGRAELWIAGTGPAAYQDSLMSRGGGGVIHWMGYVEPQKLLASVDILVVPSVWNDPAPLVAQEAMAHGLVVIAARRGGIPELVGDAGWLYDPNEPGALVDILKQATEEPLSLEPLRWRALRRAQSFATDPWLDAHESLYARLARQ